MATNHDGSAGAPGSLSAGFAAPLWIRFLITRRQWLLASMLLTLHFSILFELSSPWTRALLLAHIGLFLLWQPLWRGESRITPRALLFVAAAVLAVLAALNWWLLAFWCISLISLVGGRSFSAASRWSRLSGLTALSYLLITLLLWVVPKLFNVAAPAEFSADLMWFVMPVLLVAVALLPAEQDAPSVQETVDFFYGLLLLMVVLLLVLGSFAFMTLNQTGYLDALVRTLFAMAAILIFLGLVWTPRYGFALLQPVVFKYLLNVGTPFEQWLSRIADAAEEETESLGFLRVAARNLSDLPWVEGVAWNAPEGRGRMGQKSANHWTLRSGQLELEICSRYPLGPAMALHLQLLTEIVARFYEGKRREQALQQITRLKAIYETGARLTHDIKNLLQSLYALASAAQQPGEAEAFQRLVQRQLPDLARRLELTLGKLKDPVAPNPTPEPPQAAELWWESLKSRYHGRDIQFEGRLAGASQVPAAMLDSVAENLLDNAIKKRQQEPDTRIRVGFSAAEPIALTVWDSGSAIPGSVARRLFERPVDSETGLGVGLFQAQREALQHGYRISLKANRDGEVCFELSSRGGN